MTSKGHLSESLNRVSAIDALRGLAALSVLIYHARSMFWVGLVETYHRSGLRLHFNAWLGYLSVPFSYGGLGVTLFFVLSGYCIHRRGARMLAKDPCATLDCRAFAVRRFWRIYPTYVAALLLTALIDWWISGKPAIPNPGQDNSMFAFVISLLTLQGYFASFFGSNGVFWTLAMEVHLYAVYPILFLLSRRFGPRKTVLFTLFAALGYLAADQLIGIERHLPYRFDRGPVFLPFWFTWAMGFYIAELEAGRAGDFKERVWKLLMAGGFLVGLTLMLNGSYAIAEIFWALFFAGLLRWSLKPEGKHFWSRWFGVGLAFVGVFSYSLYAIHAPLLQLYGFLIKLNYQHKFTTLWPAIGGAVFAVASAWVFFRLIEWWSIRKPGGVVNRGNH